MKFLTFAQYLEKLEVTASRLEMTAQLAQLFQELKTEEIPVVCYLMQGKLVPSYQSLEFNMSEKLTMRALAKLLNHLDQDDSLPSINLFKEQDDSLYLEKIKKANKDLGDLGLAIEQLLENTQLLGKDLLILEVHKILVDIADEEGEGSQDRKINKTYELLLNLQPASIKFVVRIIVGKLRLGFSTMTIIDALSWVRHQNKSDSKKIEAAYQKRADIGQLAQEYLQRSSKTEVKDFFDNYQVALGIPVMPALCQRLNTAHEIVEKMGRVIIEPKYDGLRVQIHINKADKEKPVQIFTRNLDNVTHMFPEILEEIDQIQAQNCILDAEAIAYDPKSKKLLTFQETITRKRKHQVVSQSEKVPLMFYVFDILYLNNEPLIDEPLNNRKKILQNVVEINGIIKLTEVVETQDPGEIQQYHEQQLEKGLEGAVIKRIDSKYRSGRKGWRWVKIKESEGTLGKLSDTLDCVVMGYYRGKGKRSQFGIGAFLVGVLSSQKKLKTIAKIGTGLTDEEFKYIKKEADKYQVSKKPLQYDVPKDLQPDVWVSPKIVVEIAADELTVSPLHSAGRALRFPRLVKFRDDKNWEQATSVKELESIKIG
jgi:DNA ligase-1